MVKCLCIQNVSFTFSCHKSVLVQTAWLHFSLMNWRNWPLYIKPKNHIHSRCTQKHILFRLSHTRTHLIHFHESRLESQSISAGVSTLRCPTIRIWQDNAPDASDIAAFLSKVNRREWPGNLIQSDPVHIFVLFFFFGDVITAAGEIDHLGKWERYEYLIVVNGTGLSFAAAIE